MVYSTPRGHPSRGDVVIGRSSHSEVVYLVSLFGDPPTFLTESMQHAVASATQLAQRGSVDVWYTEDNVIFALLVSHRA